MPTKWASPTFLLRGPGDPRMVAHASSVGSPGVRADDGAMVTEERLAQIEALVSPVLREHDLTLVDLEWRREGRRWMLRFYIDKAGAARSQAGLERVSIADCQRFSQEVGDLLDVSALIPGSYDLEVSSPGLDRQLKKERELRWAVGKAVRCWVRQAQEGGTEFSGRLRAVTEETLTLEEAGGRVRELPRAAITKVRLELPLGTRPERSSEGGG